MKVEPIKLNIPKASGTNNGTKRANKSPSIKAVNTSVSTARRSLSAAKTDRTKKRLSTASISSTPVPASSSSSSSSTTPDSGNETAPKPSPKKTPVLTATRKVKGLSHTGVATTSRRTSLKTPTTPSMAKTPTSANASPRVGPRSTAANNRRQSLAVENFKNQAPKSPAVEAVDLSYTARSRKMSATNSSIYSGGSRKNSLASAEQDGGSEKGRYFLYLNISNLIYSIVIFN
jgi:hypothetical protein